MNFTHERVSCKHGFKEKGIYILQIILLFGMGFFGGVFENLESLQKEKKRKKHFFMAYCIIRKRGLSQLSSTLFPFWLPSSFWRFFRLFIFSLGFLCFFYPSKSILFLINYTISTRINHFFPTFGSPNFCSIFTLFSNDCESF